MALPNNSAVMEFVGQQQRKLFFLQNFKKSLDQGHSHYQAFTEALQPLNAALWLKFVTFIQGSETKSEQLACQAIQDALSRYMGFPSIEMMEAWVEVRLTHLGNENSTQKQKKGSSTGKKATQSTNKPAEPIPMSLVQPMMTQHLPLNPVDPFKAPFHVHPMMAAGIRHPMMINPLMTGQMPSFIQSSAMQNQPKPTVHNAEENTNN